MNSAVKKWKYITKIERKDANHLIEESPKDSIDEIIYKAEKSWFSNLACTQWIEFPDFPECKAYKIWWLWHFIDKSTYNIIMSILSRKNKRHKTSKSRLTIAEAETIKKIGLKNLKKIYPNVIVGDWSPNKMVKMQNHFREVTNSLLEDEDKELIEKLQKNMKNNKLSKEEYDDKKIWGVNLPAYPWCMFHRIWWLNHFCDDETKQELVWLLIQKNQWKEQGDISDYRNLRSDEIKFIQERWLKRLKSKYPNLTPWNWNVTKLKSVKNYFNTQLNEIIFSIKIDNDASSIASNIFRWLSHQFINGKKTNLWINMSTFTTDTSELKSINIAWVNFVLDFFWAKLISEYLKLKQQYYPEQNFLTKAETIAIQKVLILKQKN